MASVTVPVTIPAAAHGPLWKCVENVPEREFELPLTENVVVEAVVVSCPFIVLPATVPVMVASPVLHATVPGGALLSTLWDVTVFPDCWSTVRKELKDID